MGDKKGDSEKEASDAAVMRTNTDAFESKVAAMDAGYYSDAYLQKMREEDAMPIREGGQVRYRRAPVINRGTFARIVIKERVMDAFLSQVGTGDRVQVVSLGAGFDTFAFKLLDAQRTPRLDYVELDLAGVVASKRRLCGDMLTVGPAGVFQNVERVGVGLTARTREGSSYTLLACDLREAATLPATLEEHAGLQKGVATIIISEICLVYLQAAESDAVIRTLGDWLSGTRAFVNVEQTASEDAFGRVMQQNVAARGSPLLGLRVYGSVDAQRRRFVHSGWSDCHAFSMLEMLQVCVSARRRRELQAVQMLDEVEEFNLLLSHYCVVVAMGAPVGSDGARGGGGGGGLDALDVAKLMECVRRRALTE